MKPSFHSLIPGWLVLSAVFTGGCLLGLAAQEAESPVSPPPPPNTVPQLLTLEGAIRLALENNLGLRAAAGRMDVAAGRAHQARLWSNPALELSAEDWPVSGGGFADAKKLVGVSQTVPFPGKKKLDRQIGLAGVRLSESERGLRRLELVRDV
jgi:outer membrane protein TolC